MVYHIDLVVIAPVGGVVEHLAPGVAQQELRPAAGMPQARLEGVVVGVPHRREIAVAADGIGKYGPGAVDHSSRNGIVDPVFPIGTASRNRAIDRRRPHLATLAHA